MRIFVSSIITGFSSYRNAARSAISSFGYSPVIAEDFPATQDSPRNACLNGVENSDVFLLILTERGGSVAPSGKLIIEEEFEHAQLKQKPILVFNHIVEKDDSAEAFCQTRVCGL